MKGWENPTYLTWYIISNIVGVIFMWLASKRPRIARMFFVLLFGWAFYFNLTSSIRTPEIYLTYSEMACSFLSRFINGWFSRNITMMVATIAIGQGLLAAGFLLRGIWVKCASLGAMIFLIAIAPLGVGAAFPFSVTVSIAAFLVMKNDSDEFIWSGKR